MVPQFLEEILGCLRYSLRISPSSWAFKAVQWTLRSLLVAPPVKIGWDGEDVKFTQINRGLKDALYIYIYIHILVYHSLSHY